MKAVENTALKRRLPVSRIIRGPVLRSKSQGQGRIILQQEMCNNM